MEAKTPNSRMPQTLLMAVYHGDWARLRALDARQSVLLDLWDPQHLGRAHPAHQGRINRLSAGVEMLGEGLRASDARGTALEFLLAWSSAVDVSGELSLEEANAWASAFLALESAGLKLRAPLQPEFEEWSRKDTWAVLSKNKALWPVVSELMEKSSLRVHVPPCPQWPAWPADPTKVLIEESSALNPTEAWMWALDQGYVVAGEAGVDWLASAAEWDHGGHAIRCALASGTMDVHVRGSQGLTALERWVGAAQDAGGFVSILGLRALLEHDLSVLDGVDSMERPLCAGVLDLLEATKQTDGYKPSDVRATKDLVLSYRRSQDLDALLSPSDGNVESSIDGATGRARL